jgi:hypothetical protein
MPVVYTYLSGFVGFFPFGEKGPRQNAASDGERRKAPWLHAVE